MTLDQWIIFATLALTLVLFISIRRGYDVAALLLKAIVVAVPLILIFWPFAL